MLGGKAFPAIPARSEQLRPAAYSPHVRATFEASQQSEINSPLREYLRIISKSRWVIFITTLVVVVLTSLYSFLATPMFTATSTVEIGTYEPLLPNANVENNINQQTREASYVNTQIARIASLTVADKAFSQGELAQKVRDYFSRASGIFSVFTPVWKRVVPEHKITSKGKEEPAKSYEHDVTLLRKYVGLLSVEGVKKTSLVKIAVASADPELSAEIANAHAQAFIDLVRSERQNSTIDDLSFLEDQAAELADKVAASERELANYAEKHGIVTVKEDEHVVLKKLELLNELLSNVTAERIQAETAFKEAQAGNAEPTMAFEADSTTQLRTVLKEAEAEYAMMAEKFKPSYPKMIQQKARIDALKENLKQYENDSMRALGARYRAKLEAEKSLKDQFDQQQSKAFELSRLLVNYNIMEREFQSLKDLHQSVLTQLKQAQLTAQSKGTSIYATERATPPTSHSSPHRARNILLALFLGPLLGFAIALGVESFDNTFHSPRDVHRLLQLPTLGIVPLFDVEGSLAARKKVRHLRGKHKPVLVHDDGTNSPSENTSEGAPSGGNKAPVVTEREVAMASAASELVTIHSPQSVASEAFRTVRTAMQYISADKQPRIVLFTSGVKGEGKTTVAGNVAVAFAQAGHRTILIDADLRRPSLHALFNFQPELSGLSEYLTSQKDLDQVLYPTSLPQLTIVPSGSRPPNPAELIGSVKMAEMLTKFSEQYDYVLVDAPPVLPVTDVLTLLAKVDGVVLVVRGQETERHIAGLAVNRLDQLGGRILGVVLNNIDTSSDYYYYYSGAYAYHYGDDMRAANS